MVLLAGRLLDLAAQPRRRQGALGFWQALRAARGALRGQDRLRRQGTGELGVQVGLLCVEGARLLGGDGVAELSAARQDAGQRGVDLGAAGGGGGGHDGEQRLLCSLGTGGSNVEKEKYPKETHTRRETQCSASRAGSARAQG